MRNSPRGSNFRNELERDSGFLDAEVIFELEIKGGRLLRLAILTALRKFLRFDLNRSTFIWRLHIFFTGYPQLRLGWSLKDPVTRCDTRRVATVEIGNPNGARGSSAADAARTFMRGFVSGRADECSTLQLNNF